MPGAIFGLFTLVILIYFTIAEMSKALNQEFDQQITESKRLLTFEETQLPINFQELGLNPAILMHKGTQTDITWSDFLAPFIQSDRPYFFLNWAYLTFNLDEDFAVAAHDYHNAPERANEIFTDLSDPRVKTVMDMHEVWEKPEAPKYNVSAHHLFKSSYDGDGERQILDVKPCS